jgi:hypothetical protein
MLQEEDRNFVLHQSVDEGPKGLTRLFFGDHGTGISSPCFGSFPGAKRMG